jgi:hypothetical protein
MTPYYDRDGITIYHGDSREILPALGRADCIITDPVWPNAIPELFGADDPLAMFSEVATRFPDMTERVVVHLGCDSDPRFLTAIPGSLPFFRACWLEYVRPHYKGRLLYGSDVAYAFGSPPPPAPGARVIPGRMIATKAERRSRIDHPSPRKYEHVHWLVRWFARGVVLDPFMGAGTTLLVAKNLGLPAIGIEVSEAYCNAAIERLQQSTLPIGNLMTEGVTGD